MFQIITQTSTWLCTELSVHMSTKVVTMILVIPGVMVTSSTASITTEYCQVARVKSCSVMGFIRLTKTDLAYITGACEEHVRACHGIYTYHVSSDHVIQLRLDLDRWTGHNVVCLRWFRYQDDNTYTVI